MERTEITVSSPLRTDSPLFAGPEADHLAVIAPAYLQHLTDGAAYVDVAYLIDGEVYTDRHTPCAWRDGACVGTDVQELPDAPVRRLMFFYQYKTASGIAAFDTLAEATIWAENFLARAPSVTIIRES
jgi:hypothetical protein